MIAATGSASWLPAVAAIAVAVTVFVIANRKASAEAAAAATPPPRIAYRLRRGSGFSTSLRGARKLTAVTRGRDWARSAPIGPA